MYRLDGLNWSVIRILNEKQSSSMANIRIDEMNITHYYEWRDDVWVFLLFVTTSITASSWDGTLRLDFMIS